MHCNVQAKYIRFNRIFHTVLLFGFALSESIWLIYIVTAFSLFSFVFGIKNSLTNYLFSIISLVSNLELEEKAQRAFELTRGLELFQEGLRSALALLIIFLYLQGNIIGAVSIAYIIGILSMISSLFGFCVTAVIFMGLKHLFGKN